jgi:AcrR family transcriptional regulator
VTNTPYRRAHELGQAALRRAVLDTASTLLVEHGPEALTMRRLAGEVGCSTTVLYTMFGAKDGLADALYREGFARLRARIADAVAAETDPLERLAATGRAYRANALRERSYYGLMFAGAIPGFVPSPESMALARQSLRLLTDAIEAAIAAGALTPADPDEVTDVLWAAVHGVVSLELAGHYPDDATAEQRFRILAAAALAPYVAGATR